MRPAVGLAVAAVAVLLAGCANPDASPPSRSAASGPASPGEPPHRPLPHPPVSSRPRVQRTPRTAVERFAALYINWSYRTLGVNGADARRGRGRPRAAVGTPARRERTACRRSHARMSGTADGVLALAPERDRPGWWVLVTREQTGGQRRIRGAARQDHLTLARAVAVPGGWAVSEWSPQS